METPLNFWTEDRIDQKVRKFGKVFAPSEAKSIFPMNPA